MNELNELQDIYKASSIAIVDKLNQLNVAKDIMERIKTVEKRILRINLIKIGTVTIIMLLFFSIFRSFNNLSFLHYAGLVIIFLATVIFISWYWKIQFRLSNLRHDLPGNEFIEQTLVKIHNQKSLFRQGFLYFVLALICGMNILYFALLSDESALVRFQFHGIISGMFIILYFLGLKIRDRKFKKDFGNLIQSLENAKNEF